jgi:RNA polymerase sigma factor (sigma-70 family)
MEEVRIVASKIGVDGDGFVWGFEPGRRAIVKKRWHNRRIPDPPIVRQRGPDLISIVNKSVAAVLRKYRVPEHMKFELTSGAQLSVSKAYRRFEDRYDASFDKYLMVAGMRGCVDVLRETLGRNRNEVRRRIYNARPIEYTTKDGETVEMEIADDPVFDPFEELVRMDGLRELIATIPPGRSREIMLRLADGQTMAQIGVHFGVTESRISQIVTKVRRMLEGGEKWSPQSDPFSLSGSWR